MKVRDSGFSRPERSIKSVKTISKICGKSLLSVGLFLIIVSVLTASRRLEATEQADSLEKLELDAKNYPQLPENVGTFVLHQRKGTLRQFVAAARRMYYSKYVLQLYC